MKKLLLVIFIHILSISIHAQFHWAKCEGMWAYDYGYGIAADNSGNVYVAGKYENTAIFSNNTITCAGNHDAFVVKYNSTGAVQWIRTAGGPGGDYAEALALDNNFVYSSGEIEGYGTSVSFPGSSVTLQTAGDNDVYFCKYNLEGDLIFAKREGNLNSEKALTIAPDPAGNIVIAGYFTDNTEFNGTTFTGWGYRDCYIAKYDASGNFLWFRKAGSAGRDEIKSVKCDALGNIYVCGMYSNNADFEGTIMNCPGNWYECFIAKYSSSGNLIWIKRLGGDVDDVAWSLTIDNAGTVYVAGEFNAYATFGGGIAHTSAGNADIYVAAFDASGSVLWARKAGGPLIDRARGIGTNGSNIYITGQFGGSATFGSWTINAADSSDIYIAGLDPAGNWLFASAIGGVPDDPESLGYESGNAIAGNGLDVYATGGLLNGGKFGQFNLTPYSRTDVFIAKASILTIGLPELNNSDLINVYPNPAQGILNLSFQGMNFEVMQIRIYNSLGVLVEKRTISENESQIDMNAYSNGIYYLLIEDDKETRITKKIVLQN